MYKNYEELLSYKKTDFDTNLFFKFGRLLAGRVLYYPSVEQFTKCQMKEIKKLLSNGGEQKEICEINNKKVYLIYEKNVDEDSIKPCYIIGYDIEKNKFAGFNKKELLEVANNSDENNEFCSKACQTYIENNFFESSYWQNNFFDSFILIKDKQFVIGKLLLDDYGCNIDNIKYFLSILGEDYIKYRIKENLYLLMPTKGLETTKEKLELPDKTIIPFTSKNECIIVSINELTSKIQGLCEKECENFIRNNFIKYFDGNEWENLTLGEIYG